MVLVACRRPQFQVLRLEAGAYRKAFTKNSCTVLCKYSRSCNKCWRLMLEAGDFDALTLGGIRIRVVVLMKTSWMPICLLYLVCILLWTHTETSRDCVIHAVQRKTPKQVEAGIHTLYTTISWGMS